MPPRRSHFKSRLGCIPCRQRRVKCDEETFPCKNCARRELPCAYQSPSRFAAFPTTDSSQSSSHRSPDTPDEARQSVVPDPTADKGPPPHNLARHEELCLLHFYIFSTAPTISRNETDLRIWQEIVPPEGNRYNFVLDGILSLAALHHALLHADTAARYTAASVHYQGRGLQAYTEQLSYLTMDNCHALFAFSTLITVHTIALSRGYSHLMPSSPPETLDSVFDLLRGTGLVHSIARPHLSSSPFQDLLRPSIEIESELPGHVDEAFSNLRLLVMHEAGQDQADTFIDTIVKLEACFRGNYHCSTPDMGSIVAWPVMVGELALGLFRSRNPLMLLMFVHYGVLFLSLHDRWWSHGFGARIVRSLSHHLHGVDSKWSQHTAWALKQVDAISQSGT